MPLTKLEAEEAASDGKTSVLTRAEYASASELIGRSFAGTPESEPEWSLHWILGPHLPLRLEVPILPRLPLLRLRLGCRRLLLGRLRFHR